MSMNEIQSTNRSLDEIFASWEKKLDQRDEELEKLKEDMASHTPKPEQTVFSFFPTQLMRTSIFFPMKQNNLAREKRLIDTIEIDHPWGKLEINGIKLAIFQEDILLEMLGNKKLIKQKSDQPFQMIYSMNKLAKPKASKTGSGANKKDKERIKRTLDDFGLIAFKIILQEKRDGKLVETKIKSFGNIISSWSYELEKDELIVNFHQDFWKFFGESMLTYINFTKRMALKGDAAKALLRFITCHNKPTEMHLLTVMDALNWDTNQKLSNLKKYLSGGINELIKNGDLAKGSKVTDDYRVILNYPNITKKVSKIKK